MTFPRDRLQESAVPLEVDSRVICRRWFRWEAVVFAGLALVLLGFALMWPFKSDEIEHVHAAWRIANGRVPYLDFFEHHHPLLWYALAGMLPLTGESSTTMLVFRLVFVLLAFATLGVTWRLAYRVTRSRSVAWLSVLLLISAMPFLESSIVIRPDPPMMLFVVLSVLFLVRAIGGGRASDAMASGAAAGVAFAFLQKAVLLFIGFAALVAVRRTRSRRLAPGSTAGWFGIGLGVTLAAAAGCLAAAGAMKDYVWTNWHFNALLTAELPRLPPKGFSILANLPFWCLGCGGVGILLRRRRGDDALGAVALIGGTIIGCLLATRALRTHYLLQMLPLLAVVAAWALQMIFERLALTSRWRMAAVVALVLVPVVARALSMESTNRSQRAAIDYVLAHSSPGEPIHDPFLQFNVFRPDLHYFVDLQTEQRLLAGLYRRTAGARAVGYDPCGVVRDGRPRFASDADGRLEACGLAHLYRPTAFPGLYERAD